MPPSTPSTPSLRPRRARRAGAALALAVAGAVGAVWAQPASALVTEVDTVTIRSVGYDLGDQTFSSGRPDAPATLEWDHAWFGVYPTLDGYMHFEGVSGECTRVRLVSYDVYGGVIANDYSDTKCANTNGHEARIVEENGNAGVSGQAGAASVRVILQHQTQNGWAKVGAAHDLQYGQIIDTDRVLIDRGEMNFGAGDFADGSPEGPAELTWASSGGPIRPTLRGNLYMEGADDLCGRVRVRYLDAAGAVLDTEYGPTPELCATSDDVHLYPVQIDAFAHNEIASVQVTLQKRGGSGVWQNAGTVTKALN